MSGVAWLEPALADLVVFALVFGPPLLLGIPAVMRNVRQPAELAVEPLADADLGAARGADSAASTPASRRSATGRPRRSGSRTPAPANLAARLADRTR